MSKRILKYGLAVGNTTELPRGKILKIMLQNGWPHIWVEVTHGEREMMTVIRCVTGAEPPNDDQHIETLCVDGYHIMHYYARGNVS